MMPTFSQPNSFSFLSRGIWTFWFLFLSRWQNRNILGRSRGIFCLLQLLSLLLWQRSMRRTAWGWRRTGFGNYGLFSLARVIGHYNQTATRLLTLLWPAGTANFPCRQRWTCSTTSLIRWWNWTVGDFARVWEDLQGKFGIL